MFFLPLFDDNPTGRVPIVTWSLIAICAAVFLFQLGLDERGARVFIFSYGAVPALITGSVPRPAALAGLPDLATVITSVFMHGGILHLGGNMLYLWIFGDNVEDSMGPIKFIIFYLACGIAATMAHVAIDPDSVTPLVGASGAIAGVLAAYLMLYPHAHVRVLVVILIFIRFTSFPALAVLAAWLIIQFLSAPASLGDGGGVAYFAHLGGFAAGLILTPFFKRRDQKIFPAKPDTGTFAETGAKPNHSINIMTRHQIKNEFVERYKHRKAPPKPAYSRRDLPKVKKSSHSKGPWDHDDDNRH
jgi:membrane associated rhomboid family serine protease